MSARFGSIFAAIVVTAILAAFLWLPVGCGTDSTSLGTTGTVSKDSGSASHAEPEPPTPLCEDWAPPAIALVLSGEQHGYLEPCGCSETQSGGIARRADLVAQLEQRGWPVTALDLGGTLKRNRTQSRIKFETLLAALSDMHYQAVALGPEELRLRPDYLLSQHLFDGSEDSPNLAFLAANVVFYDSPDLGTPVRSRVFSVNGVKIAVTAILGESLQDTFLSNDIRVDPPTKVLPEVVQELEQEDPDLLVLLSHASVEESRQLAESNPQFDLVLTAGGPEDPDEHPTKIGETLLLQVGHKGKYAGVVGFYPDAESDRLKFELVNLDQQRFKASPVMREHMRQYQDRLRDENLVANELPISHPSGWTFVGAAKCGECHKKAYAKWLDPGDMPYHHAHAYESLEQGRKGQEQDWISRVHDPECLVCHVTGWDPDTFLRYDSGFVSPEQTPHLIAQQCENCHGPGSRHVELEELFQKDRKQADKNQLTAVRKEMHRSIETAEKQVCSRCHDLDNSPHFEMKEYWEKIKHPWRD